nr:D-glycerate dehydrogenase [Ardenticatena sp.]
MKRWHVFITRRLPDDILAPLVEVAEVDVWPDRFPPPYEELRHRTAPCDGLLCMLTDRIDAALMDNAPHLRVISQMAVGYDNIDVAAATARRIPVGHTPGVLTESTADLAFALMLAAARRLLDGVRFIEQGLWQTWEPFGLLGQDVHGKTLGIVGLGRIGAATARRALGFGMRLLYTGPREKPDVAAALGATYVSFDELLAKSDMVSIHCPLTPATYHLFDADAFARMKPGAILVNTARGGIVDHEALLAVIRTGHLGAAGLDVTEPEPLPPDHPLMQCERLILTPHIGSATVETRRRMAQRAIDNLLAGLRGERLPSCVNPEVYADT